MRRDIPLSRDSITKREPGCYSKTYIFQLRVHMANGTSWLAEISLKTTGVSFGRDEKLLYEHIIPARRDETAITVHAFVFFSIRLNLAPNLFRVLYRLI